MYNSQFWRKDTISQIAILRGFNMVLPIHMDLAQ